MPTSNTTNISNASCAFACPLAKCTANDKERESRRREEEREREGGRGREGERRRGREGERRREREGERRREREGGRGREREKGGNLSYLKRDVLTVLQSNHLLSPVQKVCVVDDIGPEL